MTALRALVLLVAAPVALAAQTVRATGSVSASGELYNRSGAGNPARPDQTGRLVANLTLAFADGLLTIPLTALVSTDQVSFRQNINQLGVSPTWRGVTMHLGHFTPTYSRYTLVDATVLGGGVDLRRGALRVGALGGRVRKAIEPDTAGFPELARFAYAGRVGVGPDEGSFIHLFGAVARDDDGSLDSAVIAALPSAPEEFVVFGVKARAALLDRRLAAETELAHSQHERDITVSSPAAKALAASGKLVWDPGTWSLAATVEYLEPEFKTFGNSGLVGDRLDYGLTGRASLLQGRLSLDASGGWREDNLSDNLEATTAQVLYNATVNWQPVPLFGVGLQAGNTVHDSRAKDDTSSVKNVSGQYTVTPRFVWSTGAAQHTLVLVGGYQRSDNTTPGSVALVDTRTTMLVATWGVALPSSLGLSLTATRTGVDVDTLETVALTFQPGVSYTMVGGKLQASAQVQFTTITATAGDSREVYPLGQLRYTFARGQSVQLRASTRHHEPAGGAGVFDEQILTLTYTATWR